MVDAHTVKLQMKLYSKGKSSWRRMRLWAKWRDSSLDWDDLCATQQKLASDLVQIGDGLILPGDEDWKILFRVKMTIHLWLPSLE